MKKVFNFKLGEQSLKQLNEITEKYILNHIEGRFKALEFYKQLCEEENAEIPELPSDEDKNDEQE